jgi:hypothetical protein
MLANWVGMFVFDSSQSRALNKFDLIHCDLWTSPVTSVSGYKYYLVILDDCSYYIWTFPLRLKSDTFATQLYKNGQHSKHRVCKVIANTFFTKENSPIPFNLCFPG